MSLFLQRVAQTFYTQYGSEISKFTFVFPNRRAGLFFQRYLSEIIDKPLFSPEIITINECFFSASDWQQADKLSMLFRLYELYKKIRGVGSESFDNFVFWGEMLLTDFDDVDKYRVDAKQIFTNITELKQIDQIFNAFSENQIKAIREFWQNFEPFPEGKMQQDFITTWKILLPLYEQFRAALLAENLATEGMVYRHVADRLQNREEISQWKGKQFVFIGFNALNPCERTLFERLRKTEQADFYWDYEAEELRDSENQASYFYAETALVFQSKHTIEPVIESLQEKEIELIAVPSDVGQAKKIYSILNELFPPEKAVKEWINTAIVLPNENVLIPLLHSLPEQIEKVNVTMGFPLKATPVSGLIEHIFELQRRKRVSGNNAAFYYQTVLNILNHQYIALLCVNDIASLTKKITANNWIYIEEKEFSVNKLLASIFDAQVDTSSFLSYLLTILRQLQADWKGLADEKNTFRFEHDFLYQYYITLNRMSDIMAAKPVDLDMSLDTLMRLIRQLTATISIPFVGEPLEGLQIMGTLETRGLDFENLIISSFNEGIFPKRSPQNSFIPYNLRRGFNLSTTEHQDALSAYNFYRLIHRAKRIFFLYDSRTEGVQTGEVSRFAHQLHYHYGVNIKRKSLTFDIGFETPKTLQIAKSKTVMEKLERFLMSGENEKALSASSINSYIDCPLQFYLTRVEEIQQADEVKETVEDNMFGTIFHAVMEYLYKPYKGRVMQTTDFDAMIKNTLQIEKEINRAFSVYYFKKKDGAIVPLEGNNLLIAHVIRKYILQILRTDKQYAPFRYVGSEERCHIRYAISGGSKQVNIKGFIDRVDEKEGRVRILDYKTGSGSLDFKSFDEVFEHDKDKRPKYVLQTFLYGILYKEDEKNKDFANEKIITPGIYYMRDVFKEDFETQLHYKSKEKDINEVITDFSVYENEFREHLTACLEEIFNPEIPFIQSESTKPCQYCPYKGVCNR